MSELQEYSIDEKREIRSKLKELFYLFSNLNSKPNLSELKDILRYSEEKVRYARRLDGELCIVHSLNVACIVAKEIGLGQTTIQCALLYDLFSKDDFDIDEVRGLFKKDVDLILNGLLKVKELYTNETSIESENFRKLLLSLAQDIRVILIIIADRLQVMRTLHLCDEETQRKVASEVGYLYAPLAHRLGLYNIKSEMEDLVMKFTNKKMYLFIAKKLNETKVARDQYIADFIAPLKKQLEDLGLKFEIKGRTKTIHSIHNKMSKQNTPFEKVYDLFAIRVILDSEGKNEKPDCWKVYSVVADKYQPNPSRLRDWLSVPKTNGYESLHTTVLGPEHKWVEVQIRTRRMNEVAEKGLAAHWKYKGGKSEEGMDQLLANIREVLENPERNAVDFIDDFKLNLYDKEVFVFTPKGDLKRLPKGATVLDFAFDIHTDVGKKCVGAVINGKHASIKQVLQNGDHIEILTSSKQQPNEEWLNIVVTGRARAKLKQAIRDQENKEAEVGKEILQRRFKNWKIEFNDQLLNLMVKHFRSKTINSFYRMVAMEEIEVATIKEFVLKELEKGSDDQNKLTATNFTVKEDTAFDGSNILLIDKNLKNVDYSFAKCCNPIFGDDVFGFVSSQGGIKIHRKTCPNAPQMFTRFGYRVVNAQWTAGADETNFQATIRVTGADQLGIVGSISHVINKDMSMKMRSISIDSNAGGFEGTVTVFVNDTSKLESLIKKIKQIKGIYSANRIDSVFNG